MKQREVASRRAPAVAIVAIEPSIPVCENGKRNIIYRMEEEKSCKFQADPLIEKEAIAIEAKRQQRDKRIT